MATLKIWTDFSKKKNSTKQPTGGTDVDVKLKENTSIENPVFICNNLDNANYCQYAGNYYFIDDIVFISNTIVELHCSMDSLATNKSAIAGYNCFVERCSSAYDNMICDNYLSQKQTGTYTTGTEQDISDYIDTTHGIYIVRVLGPNAITGFAMTKSGVRGILNFANTFSNFDDVFPGLDQIVDGAVKGVFNPDKFIVSCKWFPLKTNAIDLDGTATVYLGNWSTQHTASVVNNPKVVINKTVALPTPIYTDFRRYDSSWTKIHLYLPCIGSVELDPALYPNGVGVKYITDLYSGALTVLLADADNNVPIQQFNGTMGVDVAIGKAYQNTLGMAGGFVGAGVGAIGGALTGNPLGLVAGAALGLNSVKATASPNSTIIGGTSTIATIQAMPQIKISLFAYNTCDFPVINHGRPLNRFVNLGSLAGFIKCSGASLDSIAYGNEKDEVNNYLNTGFYME